MLVTDKTEPGKLNTTWSTIGVDYAVFPNGRVKLMAAGPIEMPHTIVSLSEPDDGPSCWCTGACYTTGCCAYPEGGRRRE